MTRRHGFTLLETLMVAAIGVMVLALLWELYISGNKQSSKLQTRLSAIQGAQLLVERIRQDVAGFVYAPGDTRPLVESAMGAQANQLNLLVYSSYRFFQKPSALYDPGDNDPSWIEARRISYLWNPQTRFMTRRQPGQDETLSFARFLKVDFVTNSASTGLNLDNCVTVEMTCASDEELANPTHAPTDVIVMPVAIPLHSKSQYLSTSLWADCYFHQQPKIFDRAPGH